MSKTSRKSKSKKKLPKEQMVEEFQKQFMEKSSLPAIQACFHVERMLGRPFKKFNLLVIKDEGQYFSSSDNFLEITNYIHNANAEYSAEYYLWLMRIKDHNDKTFYACINIKDKPEVVKHGDKLIGIIDTTYYFHTESI